MAEAMPFRKLAHTEEPRAAGGAGHVEQVEGRFNGYLEDQQGTFHTTIVSGGSYVLQEHIQRCKRT